MNIETTFHFAHLTDIHISENGDAWGTLDMANALLNTCIEQLNQIDDLDCVLITGDVMDRATKTELQCVIDALSDLNKPWHFVPGNHDGYIDPNHPDAFRPHEAIPLLDPRMADPTPYAQKAYWSRAVAPGVQMIGLDSRMADHWDGVIEPDQLAWLEQELDALRDDLVIIAVHHPLHNLGPHNEQGDFTNFICSNGEEVEVLLDGYPHVKLVMAGHHHANQLALRNGRMHINTAALTGYPCVYRTIRVTEQPDGWHANIETHTVLNEKMLEKAYRASVNSGTAAELDPDDRTAWPKLCKGRPEDWAFDGLIG